MDRDKEEQERRKECPYYWNKGKKRGICSASPHAEYEDDPCMGFDCFWMKEWIYEERRTKD